MVRGMLRLSLLMVALHSASGFTLAPTALPPLRALRPSCGARDGVPRRPSGVRGRAGGLSMQWKEEGTAPGEEAWKNFAVYNIGRWKGRTLHISPETGDYIAPFSVNHLVDVLNMGQGIQSAKMRTTVGESDLDTAPRVAECVITANEDFHISADGSYSRDETFAEVPDVKGAFRFCIEMSLSISIHERVRFQALYDFKSRLSRIVLYEEYRVVTTGAQRLIGIKLDDEDVKRQAAIRSPLTMLSLVGEFRGSAEGTRSSRLGGGQLKSKTRSGMQWDGKTLRREYEVVDERLRPARKVQVGDMGGNVVDVLSLEDGYKLLLLPSGCFCCLPERLEPEIARETGGDEDDDDVADGSAGGDALEVLGMADKSDMAKAEAMMNGFSLKDDVVTLKAFTAEFGCYTGEPGHRKRCTRLYNTDGTMLTTTTVDETRSDGGVSGDGPGGKKGRAMYDEFE